MLVAKLVDDLLTTGEHIFVESFLNEFESKFTLETVVHGPRQLNLFGLTIAEHDDMTSSINGN